MSITRLGQLLQLLHTLRARDRQSARVKQHGLGFKGDETTVAWAEMEIAQFQEAVIEPSFTKDQTRLLHTKSGRGFQRIISWVDTQSGIDKEELRKTREEFQES